VRPNALEQSWVRSTREERQRAVELPLADAGVQFGGIEDMIDQHLEAALVGRAVDARDRRGEDGMTEPFLLRLPEHEHGDALRLLALAPPQAWPTAHRSRVIGDRAHRALDMLNGLGPDAGGLVQYARDGRDGNPCSFCDLAQ
jgi:hypothetical protein